MDITLLWFMAGVAFFFHHLEEYYLTNTDFPYFHGANEGTIMQLIISTLTGYVGQDFWLTEFNLFGINTTYNYAILYLCLSLSMLTSLISIIKILMSSDEKVHKVLYNMTSYMLLVGNMIFFIYFSEKNSYTYLYPKLIIYMYGFIFTKLMVIKLAILNIFIVLT